MNLPSSTEASSSRALMLWAALVTGLSLVLRIRWAPTRSFDVDELHHMHAGYLVYVGLVPYRDFFDHHTPWLRYLLALIFPVFGESIAALVAARALMLAIAVVVLYLTYRLGREVYGRFVGAFGALFLAFTLAFVEKTAEIRPDVPATACWLASVWLFVRAERTADWRAFLRAGVWLGAAVMFTPNALFGAAGVVAALCLVLFDRRFGASPEVRRTIALGFAAGAAAPILATALVFQAYGALVQFVNLTVAMNARWPVEISPLGLARRMVVLNPYLVALALVGSVSAAAGLKRETGARRGEGVLLLATVALLAGLVVHPAPYRQYFLFFLPLLAIFAANVLQLALALPPVSALVASASGSGVTATSRTRLITFGGALLLCAACIALLQRTDGSTFVAQAFMWPALLAVGAASGVSHRRARVGLVAAILIVTCVLLPLGPLRAAVTLLSLFLIALAWILKGRPLTLAAVMSGVVAYPLSVIAAEAVRGNEAQRLEIQYVLDTTSPDDFVQGGWTMTTLFRRGASYYTVVPPGLQALVPEARLDADLLRAIGLRKPVVIENDAALAAFPSVVNHVGEHYEPTGIGPLFRRRDAPAE